MGFIQLRDGARNLPRPVIIDFLNVAHSAAADSNEMSMSGAVDVFRSFIERGHKTVAFAPARVFRMPAAQDQNIIKVHGTGLSKSSLTKFEFIKSMSNSSKLRSVTDLLFTVLC